MIYYHITSNTSYEPKKSLLEKLGALDAAKKLADRKINENCGAKDWAIIHDSDMKQDLCEGLSLIIKVSGNFSSHCFHGEKIDNTVVWKVNDQTVLDNLQSLINYININIESGKDLAKLDPFGWIPQPQNLLALSILCQGFLMRLKLSSIENEKDEKKEIYKKAFSKVFGDEKAKTIIENVKKEWESLGDKSGFEAVEEFIMTVISDESSMDVSIVENAYQALTRRLGAASD